jgi:Leucine-rich repeat (LRR) protein
MRTLAALPKELEELDISFNHDVEVLPSLPAGCKVLRAQGCSKLRKVESLPDSLEVLDLWSCDALEELPNVLPANLKVLYLAGTRITRLPASLPRELQELDARCCKNLRRGPSSYPDSLRWINYAGSGLQGNVTAQLPSKLTLEKLNRDGYVGFGLGSGRRLADLYEDVFGVGSDSGTTICHDPDEVRGIPRPRIDDGLLP